MCAVNVGVGHDNDAVVAQLGDVKVIVARGTAGFTNTGSERRNQRQNFVAGKQLFITGFFYVQNFSAQRKNRLEFAIAALLG